jgi:hypothetical protein
LQIPILAILATSSRAQKLIILKLEYGVGVGQDVLDSSILGIWFHSFSLIKMNKIDKLKRFYAKIT